MNILSRAPLAFALSALCISAPTIAAADQSIDHNYKPRVIWLEPNGIDDTSNLQGALDRCTDSSYPCKIKLASGVFHIAPLVATNFYGEVRGAGQDVTIIRALTDRVLHLTEANPFHRFDPTPQDPWNALVMFVEGDALVRDLTMHIPAETKTDGWWALCGIFKVPVFGMILSATSRDPMRFVVRNVHFIGEGTGDEGWPFSSNSASIAVGFMPRNDSGDSCVDFTRTRGEFVFEDNRVSSTWGGLGVQSAEQADVRIGRNSFEGVLSGPQAADVWDSEVSIVSNRVEADGTGITLTQNIFVGLGYAVAEGRTEYAIVDNYITVSDEGFAGIDYFDNVDGLAASRLNVYNNVVNMGANTFTGISLFRTNESSRVQKNTISGEAPYGIYANGADACKIGLNDFSGASDESTDILLDETTSSCRVHAFGGDTVEDVGTDNRVFFK